MAVIVWFKNLRKRDIDVAGGKGANLGELAAAGMPVPPGFVVSAGAYQEFLKEADITPDLEDLLKGLNPDNTDELNLASKAIKNMITGSKMPKKTEKEIRKAYKELSKGAFNISNAESEQCEFVAVRSSATAEDLPDASFAGQQKTFLNVHGADDLVNSVKECWASLFEPRAIFYREKKGFDHSTVFMSVIVQKMIDADKAGVMFTVNPVTNDRTEITIEAAWGLGESVVSGSVTPDHYTVDKASLVLTNATINEKDIMITRDIATGKTKKVSLSRDMARKETLSDIEIQELADYGKQIEEHYKFPQDIEWAIEDKEIFILQSRAVTTLKEGEKPQRVKIEIEDRSEQIVGATPAKPVEKDDIELLNTEELMDRLETEVESIGKGPVKAVVEKEPEKTVHEAEPAAAAVGKGEELVKGFGASPGVGAGKVQIIHSAQELSKIDKGEILVTEMTNPDMVPAMERAAAIVTNEGGMTCHAAIVSRELGIPCIVGTGNATKVLLDGMDVTVDATNNVVLKGIHKEMLEKEEQKEEILPENVPETKTKVYVNLGIPGKAEEVAKLPAEGVGLMREEFIFASKIGEHPLAMIEHGEQQKFIDTLAEGIAQVAKAFNPRPVVLRLSDFKTNEYRSLKGGEKFEGKESNPMIGWRGCSRYTTEKYAPAFKLELKAVKKVRDEMGLKNVVIMLPFVRHLDDVKKVAKLMEEEGLHRGEDLKLWMMAEVPSNVFLADEFAKLVDGFSIGSNDLTQLIMGADRDSEIMAELGYFDERNDAVKRAISQLIKAAHANGITCSICGQAPSVYPEFCEFLVKEGIDSISLNPDTVIKTKVKIGEIEKGMGGEEKPEEQTRDSGLLKPLRGSEDIEKMDENNEKIEESATVESPEPVEEAPKEEPAAEAAQVENEPVAEEQKESTEPVEPWPDEKKPVEEATAPVEETPAPAEETKEEPAEQHPAETEEEQILEEAKQEEELEKIEEEVGIEPVAEEPEVEQTDEQIVEEAKQESEVEQLVHEALGEGEEEESQS